MSQKVSEDIGISRLYLAKLQSTQTRGISFKLTFNQFKSLRKRKRCRYTGVELNSQMGDPNSFTLDRIDSKKGYTPENTVPCSLKFNQFMSHLEKSGSSYEDIALMAKGLNSWLSMIRPDTYNKDDTK